MGLLGESSTRMRGALATLGVRRVLVGAVGGLCPL